MNQERIAEIICSICHHATKCIIIHNYKDCARLENTIPKILALFPDPELMIEVQCPDCNGESSYQQIPLNKYQEPMYQCEKCKHRGKITVPIKPGLKGTIVRKGE